MARQDHWQHGHFTWVDLMTTDLAAARSFYRDVFDWELDDYLVDLSAPYTVCRVADGEVCGMGLVPEALGRGRVPPTWNNYVLVDELTPVLARVPDLDGTVFLPATPVMDAGWMAGIADPGGAAVWLWQAGARGGSTALNAPNTVSWNELATRDPEAAMRFFGDLFGWTYTPSDVVPSPYWIIENQGRQNGGILDMHDAWPPDMPPHWSPYFAVKDADAICTRATELGGAIHMPPQAIREARIAILVDPQGAVFKLFEPEDWDTMD